MKYPLPSFKQIEVWMFIIDHVERHGFQPTQGEIAEHFGVNKRAIVDRLRQLERYRYVTMTGNDRGIMLHHVRFESCLTGNDGLSQLNDSNHATTKNTAHNAVQNGYRMNTNFA